MKMGRFGRGSTARIRGNQDSISSRRIRQILILILLLILFLIVIFLLIVLFSEREDAYGLSEIIGPFPVPPPRDKRERNDDPGQKRRGHRYSVHSAITRFPSIIVIGGQSIILTL